MRHYSQIGSTYTKLQKPDIFLVTITMHIVLSLIVEQFMKYFSRFQALYFRSQKNNRAYLKFYQQQSLNSVAVNENILLEMIENTIQKFSWIHRMITAATSSVGLSSRYQCLVHIKSVLYEHGSYDQLTDAMEYLHQKPINDELDAALSKYYMCIVPQDIVIEITPQCTHRFCSRAFIEKFAKASLTLKQVSKNGLPRLPQDTQAIIAAFLTNHQCSKTEENFGDIFNHSKEQLLSIEACHVGKKGTLVYSKDCNEEFWRWANQVFSLFKKAPTPENKAVLEQMKTDNPKFASLLRK